MGENWNVQVPGALSLLNDAETLLAGCEPAKDAAQKALNVLETAFLHCPELADAIDHLRFAVIANDMTDILLRCNNAVHGTRESINAYAEGDREMAESARKAASLAEAVPAPPGVSGGSGYWMVQ